MSKLPGRLFLGGLLSVAVCGSVQAQTPFEGAKAVAIESPGGASVLQGALWEPAGTAKAAVVIIHGSGGWSDAREGHYAGPCARPVIPCWPSIRLGRAGSRAPWRINPS